MSTGSPFCTCPAGWDNLDCPVHGKEAMPKAWDLPTSLPPLPKPVDYLIPYGSLRPDERITKLTDTVNQLIAYLEARDGR